MALYLKVQFFGLAGSSSPSQSTSKLGSEVAFVGIVVTRSDNDIWPDTRDARAVKALPSALSAWVSAEETDSAIVSASREASLGQLSWEIDVELCDDILRPKELGDILR